MDIFAHLWHPDVPPPPLPPAGKDHCDWALPHRHRRLPNERAASISPERRRPNNGYGASSLDQQSRSPSPPRRTGNSFPTLPSRRSGGRRLPPTPRQPSTLDPVEFPQISRVAGYRPPPPGTAAFNFPKVNASPTHAARRMPAYPVPPAPPLSFEEAVALGRGTRQLPSPVVPNGYRPGGGGRPAGRRLPQPAAESDDEDWC